MRTGSLLGIHLVQLVGRSISWHVPLHVCDIAFGRQGVACHVICYTVRFPCNMTLRHRSTQGPLGSFDVLDRPVDGMFLGLLVDPEHEAYQELAVAKDSDRESEVRAGVDQCL